MPAMPRDAAWQERRAGEGAAPRPGNPRRTSRRSSASLRLIRWRVRAASTLQTAFARSRRPSRPRGCAPVFVRPIVSCSSCHDPHYLVKSARRRQRRHDAARGRSADARGNRQPEYKVCYNCHGSGAARDIQRLMKPSNPSYHPWKRRAETPSCPACCSRTPAKLRRLHRLPRKRPGERPGAARLRLRPDPQRQLSRRRTARPRAPSNTRSATAAITAPSCSAPPAFPSTPCTS